MLKVATQRQFKAFSLCKYWCEKAVKNNDPSILENQARKAAKEAGAKFSLAGPVDMTVTGYQAKAALLHAYTRLRIEIDPHSIRPWSDFN